MSNAKDVARQIIEHMPDQADRYRALLETIIASPDDTQELRDHMEASRDSGVKLWERHLWPST